MEEQMNRLKCLQTWGFLNFPDNLYESLIEEMEHEDEAHDPFMDFRNGILLGFELYRHERYEEAVRTLEALDGAPRTDFMVRFERCLHHLSRASIAFCFHKLGRHFQVASICDDLDLAYLPFEEAGFLYLNSSLAIRYGPEGAGDCVALMTRALEVVDDEAILHNHYGQVLGRIRHHMFPPSDPTDEELSHLRRAVELCDDDPWYMCCLSRTYFEMSRSPRYRNDRKEHLRTAIQICRDSLSQRDRLNRSSIANSIFALMKVSTKSELMELREHADFCIERHTSVKVSHYLGMYYLKIDMLDRALQLLSRANTTLPYLTSLVLYLEYHTNDHFDPLAVERRAAELRPTFTSLDDTSNLLLSLAEFSLLIIEDIERAVGFFKEFLDINPNLKFVSRIKVTKSMKSLSIVEVMVNLILSYRGDNESIIALKNKVSQLKRAQNFQISWKIKKLSLNEIISDLMFN